MVCDSKAIEVGQKTAFVCNMEEGQVNILRPGTSMDAYFRLLVANLFFFSVAR